MNKEHRKIKSFTDLRAWQKGHKLVIAIYKITDKFPKKETYSLTDQMRRAATSIISLKDLVDKPIRKKRSFFTKPKAHLLNSKIKF